MIDSPESLLASIYLFAFMMGALWGSFLNVVIYRLPAGLSIVHPGSRCPSCETPIAAYDNVPILAWLWLRGKCRTCKTPISARYPAIELLVALLSLALAVHVFGGGRLEQVLEGRAEWGDLVVPWTVLFAYICSMVALFFIDLDVTELPPEITIPGALVGVVYAWIVPEYGIANTIAPNVALVDSLLGMAIGGGLIFLLIVVYYWLTGRIGLGMGDVWMMGMVGAFVGWQGLFFIFLFSSLQGIAAAVLVVAYGALRGESESSFFRNAEVEELERELANELSDDPNEVLTHDAAEASTAPESDDPNDDDREEDDDTAFTKLAIPYGPFIALSAVEYIFFGREAMRFLVGFPL